MKRLSIVAVIAVLAASPALTDGAITLPDIPSMTRDETADLLSALVVASVAAQNCEGFAISEAERALLSDSAGILAARFELDPPQYNALFLHPAYSTMTQEGACEQEGPRISPLIEQLIGWGGSVTPGE